MKTFLKGLALFGVIALLIAEFVAVYALVNRDHPTVKAPRPRAAISWNV